MTESFEVRRWKNNVWKTEEKSKTARIVSVRIFVNKESYWKQTSFQQLSLSARSKWAIHSKQEGSWDAWVPSWTTDEARDKIEKIIESSSNRSTAFLSFSPMFLCLVQRQAVIGSAASEKPFNINVAQSTFPQKWTLLNHNLHAWYGSFFDLLVNIGSFESDKSTLVNILHIRPKFKFTCWHSCSIWRETAINVVSEDIVTC